MYLAITLISLVLVILLVILFRKQLFSDENNAKLLIVIFCISPFNGYWSSVSSIYMTTIKMLQYISRSSLHVKGATQEY